MSLTLIQDSEQGISSGVDCDSSCELNPRRSCGIFNPIIDGPSEPLVYVVDLPPELWIEIFRMICDDYLDDARGCAAARSSLSLVCRQWVGALYSASDLWCDISIDTDSSTEFLDTCLENSNTQPLHIKIVHTEFKKTEICEDEIAQLHRCGTIVAAHSARWRELVIVVNVPKSLVGLMKILASVSAPELESLCLAYPGYYYGTDNLAQFYRSPPLIFAGNLPSLVELTLVGVALRWSHTTFFRRLRYLNIRSLPPDAWPTQEQYMDIFACASNLSTLILRSVGCGGLANTGVLEFPLPHVTELDVSMGVGWDRQTSAMAKLVVGFRAPCLTSFTALFFSSDSVEQCIRASLIKTSRVLVIGGRVVYNRRLGELFRAMEAVLSLDLSQANSSLVLAFSERSMTSTSLPCPQLKSLRVAGIPWSLLCEVVRGRRKMGLRLDTLLRNGLQGETPQSLGLKDTKHYRFILNNVRTFIWVPYSPSVDLHILQ